MCLPDNESQKEKGGGERWRRAWRGGVEEIDWEKKRIRGGEELRVCVCGFLVVFFSSDMVC